MPSASSAAIRTFISPSDRARDSGSPFAVTHTPSSSGSGRGGVRSGGPIDHQGILRSAATASPERPAVTRLSNNRGIMDGSLVLILHTHLPYVLHHGKWPHGSDWLCEAAAECYIPILNECNALLRDGITPD